LSKKRERGKGVGTGRLARPGRRTQAGFFPAEWAKTERAVPGTFRISPQKERLNALARDYAAMRDMYFVNRWPGPKFSMFWRIWKYESTLFLGT